MIKKLLVAIGLCVTVLTTSATPIQAENRYTEAYSLQHASHYLIGYASSAAINHWYPEDWDQRWKKPAEIVIPVLIGTVIELTDDPKDPLDVLEYGGGMLLQVTVLEWKF